MNRKRKTRWQQRLGSFTSAIARLREACARKAYTDLERAGLVQTFKICFELAWKLLKVYLSNLGYEEAEVRSVFRRSVEIQYIEQRDFEILMEAIETRNILSHTYVEEKAQEAEAIIKNKYLPVLMRIHTKTSMEKFE